MIQDGHFREGAVPYGYKLEYLVRVNKKNQPVRELVIDEEQAGIVWQMFELMVKYGYVTDRITRWLSDNHVLTSKKADSWLSTSVRHIILKCIRNMETGWLQHKAISLPHLFLALFNRTARNYYKN